MGKVKVKAISLFSGGLDSILATKIILEQKIKIEAVNFTSVFFDTSESAKLAAKKLKIKLKTFEVSKEFFKILKNPKYGYGTNLNPCIDCHMFMLKKASQYMKKAKAKFLITGEVLGERPMSQNKNALKIIDKGSGTEGFVLRPLSAKLLDVTIPEKKGWVNRDKLLDLRGRSRSPQIEMAKKWGIDDYPTPAGGCLLTDLGFSKRMKDLMEHKDNFTVTDAKFLKIGRHFRLDKGTKLIVGRNEEENNRLLSLSEGKDIVFYPFETKGPIGIGKGIFKKNHIATASAIMARYCDKERDEETVELALKKTPQAKISKVIMAKSAKETQLNRLRI